MKISLDNLKDGDLLAEDIVNINGTVLASKNTGVDATVIRKLRLWGIKDVDIAVNAATEVANLQNVQASSYQAESVNRVMDIVLLVAEKIKQNRSKQL